jgi:hypothetical protein
MQKLRYGIRAMRDPSLRRWWLATHRVAWKMIIAFLAVLGVAAVVSLIWHWWTWIGAHSGSLAAIGTLATGLALAVFAWLTYGLSRKMVELQYAPVLQLYSLGNPKTGKFFEGQSQVYEGVRWKFYLLNPGEAPIWVDHIGIEIAPTSGQLIWTSVSGFCDLLDEQGNIISPEVIVEGHSHRAVTVLLHHKETRKHLQRVFGERKQFILAGMLYQHRQLGGRDKSGWLRVVSGPFELPSKFGKAIEIL